MDELDLFRDFNRSAAGPSGDARRQAAAGLLAAIEGERRSAIPARRRMRMRRGVVALSFAAVTVVAFATTLFIDAPWRSSPGFLERAEAALTAPRESILHQRLVRSVTSEGFGCTVTSGADEMWIDQTAPHRWRAFVSDYFGTERLGSDPRGFACADRGLTELGGSDDATETLMFAPPNSLRLSPQPYTTPPGDPEYVRKLREAIASGRAHDEGTTELDGRMVERIRFEPACPVPPCAGTSYAYVDPETFFPVREEWPTGYAIVAPDGRVYRFDVVVRYLTFEYLPRTAANLALTDIRAQHPDATGP
jgi:hypothetical protein